jgi:cytochrome b
MKSDNIVWDLPTRLLHWMIALPVLLNFILDGEDTPHKVLGYISLAGLMLRTIWGFKTTGHARFNNFPLHLREVKNYAVSLLRSDAKLYEGHNPLASWAYVFIWILVALLGISGFMMGLDAFWGEEWLEETHSSLASAMQVLVLIHLTGIGFDSFKFKRKTWLGMVNGKKS